MQPYQPISPRFYDDIHIEGQYDREYDETGPANNPPERPTLVEESLLTESDFGILGTTKYYTKAECVFCYHGKKPSITSRKKCPLINISFINEITNIILVDGFRDGNVPSACDTSTKHYNDFIVDRVNEEHKLLTYNHETEKYELINDDNNENEYSPLPKIPYAKLVYDHFLDHNVSSELMLAKYKWLIDIGIQKKMRHCYFKKNTLTNEITVDSKVSKSITDDIQLQLKIQASMSGKDKKGIK
jgi:hypothetical protein